MLTYCCSSSDFLQSHYRYCSIQFSVAFFHALLDVVVHFPCIFQILQARIFAFSVLIFCSTDQNKNFCNDQELFLLVILVAVSVTAAKQKPYQKAYLLTKTEKKTKQKEQWE